MMARRGLDTVGRLARGLLDLFHYSDSPLDVVDPAKQLTNPNIRGAERELSYGARLTPYGKSPEVVLEDYPNQSYWGDMDYVPEQGLGDFVHSTRQPEEGFYDLSDDIDKFFPIALEEVKDLAAKYNKELTPPEINRLAVARAMKYVKDFGFLGIRNRKFRPSVYTQFNEVIPQEVGNINKTNLIDYLKGSGK
tara:strand:- start:1055 stop:1633 length:579 start_codon:yes stop_codon:yes gene_type:complete